MKTLSFAQTICFALMLISGPAVGVAQHFDKGLAQQTFVDANVKQIEVVVGATQRLRFGYKIPELLVENPEVVKATPVSPRSDDDHRHRHGKKPANGFDPCYCRHPEA